MNEATRSLLTLLGLILATGLILVIWVVIGLTRKQE